MTDMTAVEQRTSDFMHDLTALLLKAGVLTVVGREVDGDLVDLEPGVRGAEAIDNLLHCLSMHTCFKHSYSRTQELIDQTRLQSEDPFASDTEILALAAEQLAEESAA